jgi:hypothetical protein
LFNHTERDSTLLPSGGKEFIIDEGIATEKQVDTVLEEEYNLLSVFLAGIGEEWD